MMVIIADFYGIIYTYIYIQLYTIIWVNYNDLTVLPCRYNMDVLLWLVSPGICESFCLDHVPVEFRPVTFIHYVWVNYNDLTVLPHWNGG